MARLIETTTNFYQPGFTNRLAGWLHSLGNALVFPCHYGINQFVRAFDVFRKGRNEAMDQFSGRWEVASRPVRFFGGLVMMAVGAPLAILGQLIKVPVSYFFKKPFVYLATPKSDDAKFGHTYLNEQPLLGSIKTLSWNLAAMHSTLRAANRTRPVSSRMPEAVDLIKKMPDDEKPDVMAFQEVFTEKATRILVNGLKDEYPYIIHNVGQNTVGLNSGLMLFSKYPIERIKFEPFNERYGQNALSQKGVLCATVVLPGGQRAVMTNVHMEAGGTKWLYKLNGTTVKDTKTKQFEQAFKVKEKAEDKARIASQANSSKLPISVFMGDTNSPFSFTASTDDEKCTKDYTKNASLGFLRKRFQEPTNTENAVANTSLGKRVLTHAEHQTATEDGSTELCKSHTSSIDYNYVVRAAPEAPQKASAPLFCTVFENTVRRLPVAADISDHLPKHTSASLSQK